MGIETSNIQVIVVGVGDPNGNQWGGGRDLPDMLRISTELTVNVGNVTKLSDRNPSFSKWKRQQFEKRSNLRFI
jgi:hypothetical protein